MSSWFKLVGPNELATWAAENALFDHFYTLRNVYDPGTILFKFAGGRFTAKKRIGNREARNIAKTRMGQLMDLAAVEVVQGNPERSRRYVKLARNIGMRTNTRMLKERLFCRQCFISLVPGCNCRVRLRANRVVTHCLTCGAIRRTPYLKEKKERYHGKVHEKGTGQDGQ